MNNGGGQERWTESDVRDAQKLLAKLIARTGKAKGCLHESPEEFQAWPRFLVPAETRRLGQSEEMYRRQSPRVADNDNGRKRPREKREDAPQSRSQLTRRGEAWEERRECEGGGCVVFVVSRLRFSFKMLEAATHPDREDASETDRAKHKGFTLPVNAE